MFGIKRVYIREFKKHITYLACETLRSVVHTKSRDTHAIVVEPTRDTHEGEYTRGSAVILNSEVDHEITSQ